MFRGDDICLRLVLLSLKLLTAGHGLKPVSVVTGLALDLVIDKREVVIAEKDISVSLVVHVDARVIEPFLLSRVASHSLSRQCIVHYANFLKLN